MAGLTGLFQRSSTYNLRIFLPKNHPPKSKHQNGEFVTALGKCSHREAATLGTIKRAEVLGCWQISAIRNPPKLDEPIPNGAYLPEIYHRWKVVVATAMLVKALLHVIRK